MKQKNARPNRMALTLVAFYLLIISAVSGAACYFAYQQQQTKLIASLDMALLRVTTEYNAITEHFWRMYLPMFDTSDNGMDVLRNYFTFVQEDELQPVEKADLKSLLSKMAVQNDRVQWIAFVSQNRTVNYIYYSTQSILQELPADFPYFEELAQKEDVLEIYSEKNWAANDQSYTGLAISGGTPRGLGAGSIIVGYNTSLLQEATQSGASLESLHFYISAYGSTIFSSADGAEPLEALPASNASGRIKQNGQTFYYHAADNSSKDFCAYYTVDWTELFLNSNNNTPAILAVVTLLVVLSLALNQLLMHMLQREVAIIRSGLEQIGENRLETRITGNFQQNGFQEIANAINRMTQRLQENIERAHAYEVRQQQAELKELQAKYNPHFLYNSLEMFRARCYQNGDDETAELIATTAAIFRGYIDSRTFISLQEELAFSKRYLVLFQARYGDSVEIEYDIDTALLACGIIRNVFQPLIENYFVHGIDPGRDDNFLRFSGHTADAERMVFLIEDNGIGMSEADLQRVNAGLDEPIRSEKESYGLKNLHQRLRLFYGEGYGLHLRAREGGGLCIELSAKRLPYSPTT